MINSRLHRTMQESPQDEISHTRIYRCLPNSFNNEPEQKRTVLPKQMGDHSKENHGLHLNVTPVPFQWILTLPHITPLNHKLTTPKSHPSKQAQTLYTYSLHLQWESPILTTESRRRKLESLPKGQHDRSVCLFLHHFIPTATWHKIETPATNSTRCRRKTQTARVG